MNNVIQFAKKGRSKSRLQRVQANYTVREISRRFGLSEHHIRRWTKEGLIRTAASPSKGEGNYDFQALTQFRRVRELRSQGLTIRQIEAELQGQLNLFPKRGGRLIQLPTRLSSFEEALLLHEQGDKRAAEFYLKAAKEGECVADAYCNLGIMEYEANKVTDALNHFSNSLKHDPRHFESHFNLAHLYFEAGDLRLARLHYEMSAAIESTSASVHINLGLVYAVSGDLSEAIASLNKAKEYATDEDMAQVEELLTSLHNMMNIQG